MTNTKAEPGPFDAMEKARDDEPTFTLIGRDPCAPATIAFWADMRRKRALELADSRPEEAKAELIQCTEAETVAWEMDRWRKGQPEQSEQQPRATYTGAEKPSSDEERRAQKIAATVAELHEAAYHTNNAVEQLAALGITDQAIHDMLGRTGFFVFGLSDALTAIKDTAEAIAPKRRGITPELPMPMPEPVAPSFDIDAPSLNREIRETIESYEADRETACRNHGEGMVE